MTTEAAQVEGEAAVAEAAATGADSGVAAEAVAAGTADAAASTSALVRPENLPDEFWDDATGLKSGDLVEAFRTMKAEQEARLADVPKEGESYDLALPADFKVPEGLAVEIKADDPLWADFQQIARDAGLPKGEFGKFVGAFAKYQIAQQEADVAAYVEGKASLGANADTRIKAVEDFLKANLPATHAEALGHSLVQSPALAVTALETLIRLKSGPVAVTGAGAAGVNKFEGLQGESLLHAIRTSKAA